MSQLNWSRIIIGGLIAAIILFLSDGFFHEGVVGADWKAGYAALGANEPQHSASGMAYFAIFELGRGMISILIYALMRPFFKPGPKTAVLAGIVTWLAFLVTGLSQVIQLKLYAKAL